MSARKKASYARTVLRSIGKIEDHEDSDPVVSENLSALKSWAQSEIAKEKVAAKAARLRAKADALESGQG